MNGVATARDERLSNVVDADIQGLPVAWTGLTCTLISHHHADAEMLPNC